MGDESAPACGVATWSPAQESQRRSEGANMSPQPQEYNDSCASYWIWPEGKPSRNGR